MNFNKLYNLLEIANYLNLLQMCNVQASYLKLNPNKLTRQSIQYPNTAHNSP